MKPAASLKAPPETVSVRSSSLGALGSGLPDGSRRVPVPSSLRDEEPEASMRPELVTLREKDSRPSKTSSLLTTERMRSEPEASMTALLEASKVCQEEPSKNSRVPVMSPEGPTRAPEASPVGGPEKRTC